MHKMFSNSEFTVLSHSTALSVLYVLDEVLFDNYIGCSQTINISVL